MRKLTISILLISLTTTAYAADHRPARWCGWYARHELVSQDPGKDFNSACKWLEWGMRAVSPQPGAMVIWCGKHHRHVGKIEECKDWLCKVKSGNDGHAVRSRWRDVHGARFRVAG